MRRHIGVPIALALALALALTQAAPAPAAQNFGANLTGREETPAVSTSGQGLFLAQLNDAETQIDFSLFYIGLEGTVTAGHIHFGQPGVAGGVSAFLCGGGGKPACPDSGVVLSGTIVSADVIGPAAQGIAAGEFGELLRALRAGDTYVNVHSDLHPAGEIRGQVR